MKQIAITAQFHFKPEHADTAFNILKNIIIESRREKGCLQYELFQSGEDKNIYILIEKWKSLQDWQNHKNGDHIQAAIQGISTLLAADIVVQSYNFIM